MSAWNEVSGALEKQLNFSSYSAALAFLTEVAFAAEKQDHHPDVTWNYRNVLIRLISHDEKKITARDHRLAETIDALYHKYA